MKAKLLFMMLLSVLIMTGCNVFTINNKQFEDTTKTKTSETEKIELSINSNSGSEKPAAYPPSVMVDGVVYKDTGYVDSTVTCGTMDGKITSTVNGTELPKENDQSNFGVGYEYQLSVKDQLVVLIDDQNIIFRNIESTDDSIPDQVINFRAAVKEDKGGSLLVTYIDTAEGFQEMMRGDYSVSKDNLVDEVVVGDTVQVWFDGSVAESHPYQLNRVYQIIKMQSSLENKISWNEISENGVNEEILLENINQENLEYVAKQLQELTSLICEKGEKDKSYWYFPQWLDDAKNSEQYKNVILSGKDAVKSLYLIIYKSPNEGLYEYICAMALDELTGYPLKNKNNDESWASSMDFLEKFNKKILEEQEP